MAGAHACSLALPLPLPFPYRNPNPYPKVSAHAYMLFYVRRDVRHKHVRELFPRDRDGPPPLDPERIRMLKWTKPAGQGGGDDAYWGHRQCAIM